MDNIGNNFNAGKIGAPINIGKAIPAGKADALSALAALSANTAPANTPSGNVFAAIKEAV